MIINNNKGFTLIELAMVLFILGLLLSGLLTPLATSLEQEQRESLSKQYDDVEDALIGFAIVNGRLPCPDCPTTGAPAACSNAPNVPDDGIEDTSGTGCAIGATTTIEGNLPWVTLGVTGTDPWGNILGYHVDEAYADADPEAVCTPATAIASFSICTTANITVQDTGSTCGTAISNVASNVPVVVYSQGKQSATSCNELENTDGDSTFVDRNYNLSAELIMMI